MSKIVLTDFIGCNYHILRKYIITNIIVTAYWTKFELSYRVNDQTENKTSFKIANNFFTETK